MAALVIVEIATSGPDSGGIVRYAFGVGRGNVHERQRTIAGTTHHINEGEVTKEGVEQVAADLRVHQQVWAKQPKGGHVMHIVIATHPTDRALSDAEWKTITEDYLTARGITDATKGAVKWTAVNHGRNKAGADHTHLIISRIRSDGTLVGTWNDRPKSMTWARAAEKKYDLVTVPTHQAGVGAPTLRQGELAQAAREGREPARLRLADKMRPIAAAAVDESDYVQRLRAAGLNPKPRIDKAAGRVTGYSVELDGQRFGGGKIGPDLTLPMLRNARWDKSNGLAAAQEWQHPTPSRVQLSPAQGAVRDAVDHVEREARDTASPTFEEHRAHAALTAGITATAAANTLDPIERARLTALSRDVGRWAGPTTHRPPQHVRRAAQIVAAALGGGKQGEGQPDDAAAIAESVTRIAQAHASHRAAVAAQPRDQPGQAPAPQNGPGRSPVVTTAVPVQPDAVRVPARATPARAMRFRVR